MTKISEPASYRLASASIAACALLIFGAALAQDVCDYDALKAKYDAGELSETRDSLQFNHRIKVTRFCEKNRIIDIEDVFAKIHATERMFVGMFGSVLHRNRLRFGQKPQQDAPFYEVILGRCAQTPQDAINDCPMQKLCEEYEAANRLNGCGVRNGRSFIAWPPVLETRPALAFVPTTEAGIWTWVEGNRYRNLQHEITHILNGRYIYDSAERGFLERIDKSRLRFSADYHWWNEGLAQYVQWEQLGDKLSWERSGNKSLIATVTGRSDASEYYDGLRVMGFLHEQVPWLLEYLARQLQAGIYSNPQAHLDWHNTLGWVASWYEADFAYWKDQRGRTFQHNPLSIEYGETSAPVGMR